MPDRPSVAGLYSNGGVARRIIKAEWHVIGWCSLANPLSSLCSEQACRKARRTATHHSASHSLRNLVGVSALLWELERASALTSRSLFAEKGSCVGSCLSCPVASCSSEISPTHYHTLSPANTVPVSSCLSAAAPGQRASSCRVHLPGHACSPRRPITG